MQKLRTEEALLFGDIHIDCPTCDKEVHLNMDTSILDSSNTFNGWQCSHCNSIFNKHDDIISLGDEDTGYRYCPKP